MGWSADQGGRPTTLLGPPTFPFFGWAILCAHLSMVCVLILFSLVFFSGGPSDPWDAHVRCLIGRRLAEKGIIALHFQLKPALIEI